MCKNIKYPFFFQLNLYVLINNLIILGGLVY